MCSSESGGLYRGLRVVCTVTQRTIFGNYKKKIIFLIQKYPSAKAPLVLTIYSKYNYVNQDELRPVLLVSKLV